MVILVVEILGTMIVAPYYGTTVYVWSSLIGLALLALTGGYFIGGFMADRNPSFNRMYLIILVSSLLVLCIPYIAPPVLKSTNALGPRMGALASAAILFTLPLLALGMVSPYAVRLRLEGIQDAGMTAGSLYGVSTIGSVIGAIMTGFFLIPLIGVKAIIDIMAALLAVISLAWFIFGAKKKAAIAVFLVLVPIIVFKNHEEDPSYRRGAKIIYHSQTLYSKLRIVDYVERYRAMILDNALQTIYDMGKKEYDLGYIKMFVTSAKQLKGAKTALVIGLGGGAMDKVLRSIWLEVENVEIDPHVADAAKNYFDFDGVVTIADGRNFVRNTKKKYDMIILDAYNGFSVAQFMLSREAFAEMKNALNPGGALVINTVGKLSQSKDGLPEPKDRLIFAVNNTLSSVFKYVSIISDVYGISNYVYRASDTDIAVPPGFMAVNPRLTKTVVTDNYNPVESLTNDIIEDWRAEEIRRTGSLFLM